MAQVLKIITKKILGEINIFDSEQVRYLTGGVTIDSTTITVDGNGSKYLKAGTFLAKITASGKYAQYSSGASDGRQNPVCVLSEDIDATYGDVSASAFDHARVKVARLPVAPDATVKTALSGVTFI